MKTMRFFSRNILFSCFSSLLLLGAVVLFLMIFTFGAGAATPIKLMADIQKDVVTEFGTYHPELVDVVPSIPAYSIADDFSNVRNYNRFSFTEKEKQLLQQNGFIVKPSQYTEMYSFYGEAKLFNLPIFVTTDAMLHTFHKLYDYILQSVETDSFINDLLAMTLDLEAGSERQYQEASDPEIKEAARKNMAYFSVAASYLQPEFVVPAVARDIVTSETKLIDAHQGVLLSPLFGYSEDYTQYITRGHYTQTFALKRYFIAMMWYGRMIFPVEKGTYMGGGISSEMVDEMTRRAFLMVKLLDESIDSEAKWQKISTVTSFFVGKSDDIGFSEYRSALEAVYGKNFGVDFEKKLVDKQKFQDAILYIQKNTPRSKINTGDCQGFKLMGQKFTPDSYMITELVYPKTEQYMPRGLDIMAVLGSERALAILDSYYHDLNIAGVKEQITVLKNEYQGMNESVWAQNLYWNWLYSLMPLLSAKGPGFPFYMQNQAWQDKELSCALGSWAELRHDTILYAKQTYATGVNDSSYPFALEYVEPDPWVFSRLAALSQMTFDGLNKLNLLTAGQKGTQERLLRYLSLARFLKECSVQELSNLPLSVEQRWNIRNIGTTLLAILSPDGSSYGLTEDNMAVIADVHTDGSSNTVLEEGVGYPMNLYVIVGSGDQLSVAIGSVFSHYEFAQPSNKRLTDEAWRAMLDKTPAPQMEGWTSSFISLDSSVSRNKYEDLTPSYHLGDIVLHKVDWQNGQLIFDIDLNEFSSYYLERYLYSGNCKLQVKIGSTFYSGYLQPLNSDPNRWLGVVEIGNITPQSFVATIYMENDLNFLRNLVYTISDGGSSVDRWWMLN